MPGRLPGASGKIEGYKYEVKQSGADRLIFFMDISGQFRMCVMALSISSAIALICWLVILLFVTRFPGRWSVPSWQVWKSRSSSSQTPAMN